MICRRLRWFLIAVLVLSPVSARSADDDHIGPGALRDNLAALILDPALADSLKERFNAFIRDPETLNTALEMLVETGGRWDLLKDLQLRFKTFDASDGNASGLGLAYQYEKDIKREQLAAKATLQSGLEFSFSAEGNVAFEQSINPRDFLRTGLDFSYFRSNGGAVETTDALRASLNALEDTLTAITSAEELFESNIWRDFYHTMQRSLSTQTYWDVAAALNYETNQAFTVTQLVYSGQVGFDLKAWKDESALARWNFFDWPAALIRLLDDVDQKFTPRGSTIPTLIAGIDWVDPSENPFREAIDEMDSYPRARVEAAYKSLVAQHGDNDVFWLMDFRYYSEIGPPDAVKAANQEDFSYFATALTIGESLFVSYSDGKLPFDVESDKVYELGFRLTF